MAKQYPGLALISALFLLVSGCKESKMEEPSKTGAPSATASAMATASDSNLDVSLPKDSIPVFAPKDEWALSASLTGFKADLIRAMDSSDQEGILATFSSILEFNPGTPAGPSGVVQVWGLDGSKEKLAGLIGLLDTLISNGGCFLSGYKDSSFVAPAYNCLSETEKSRCGESGCGIITKAGIPIKIAPDRQAGSKGTFSRYEIIPFHADTLCNERFTQCDWRKVKRANGEAGFVPSSDLRNVSDGEIHFVKEKTGWKIRALQAQGILTDDT